MYDNSHMNQDAVLALSTDEGAKHGIHRLPDDGDAQAAIIQSTTTAAWGLEYNEYLLKSMNAGSFKYSHP